MYKLVLGGTYIEITSFCNKDCPYCYNDSTIDGIVLNKELGFRIIDECHNCGISSISISGGEPFAHPNIYEILSKLDALHNRIDFHDHIPPMFIPSSSDSSSSRKSSKVLSLSK